MNTKNFVLALIAFIGIVITALTFLNAVVYNNGELSFNFNINQYTIMNINLPMFLMTLGIVSVILAIVISIIKG